MSHYIKYMLLLIVTFACAQAASAITAREIVNKCTGKLEAAPSLTATFKFSGSDIAGSGSIVVSGNRFKMSVGDVRYYYDGKTLWSYFISNEEVYVSEPTAAELAEINPMAVLGSIKSHCDYTSVKAPQGTYKVKCKAKDKNVPFLSMTVTVNATTCYPTSVQVQQSQGGLLTLTLDKIAAGKAVPASVFTFSAKDAPDAEVIDMR